MNCVNISNERQKHGFQYELQTIEKYNLKKAESYTCPYDAYYNDIPVQIKCIKHGSNIEMGDYLRNKSKNQDFILIIGFWSGEKTNIVKEEILFIDHIMFKKCLQFDYDTQLISDMKPINNSRDNDLAWKLFCNKYKKLWPKNNLLRLRFKRDHKTQKRIQCAIPWRLFNQFCKQFPNFDLKF